MFTTHSSECSHVRIKGGQITEGLVGEVYVMTKEMLQRGERNVTRGEGNVTRGKEMGM